ncbi:unnamed protein product [Absidia cylindrospora]
MNCLTLAKKNATGLESTSDLLQYSIHISTYIEACVDKHKLIFLGWLCPRLMQVCQPFVPETVAHSISMMASNLLFDGVNDGMISPIIDTLVTLTLLVMAV